MYKIIVAALFCAVCMNSVMQGQARFNLMDAPKTPSGEVILDPLFIEHCGYEIGTPNLAPMIGPLTGLNAAALRARAFVGRSNPVIFGSAHSGSFMGAATLGIVAM